MAVKRLKLGDVFTIPLGDGRFGVGQAVRTTPQDSVFMLVFDLFLDEESAPVDLDELIADAQMRLGAWAGSELVEIGRWKVIGNTVPREDFRRPAFKVAIGRPGNFYVEDWEMTRRRPATPEEATRLPLRTSFSAMAVEVALKGGLGLDKWYDQFDAMLLSSPSTQEMFGDD